MSATKINGVKFFQDHLNALKAEHDFSPLPASAIATYILFHLNCNDLGTLRARDQENALQKWSDKTGIPYSTLHTGREILFKRNFMKDTFNGNDQLYEISGYGEHNTATTFNYFRVPYSLKDSSILKKLVSAKDSTGLLMLLDLFNGFHRDARRAQSVAELRVKRSMNFLKKAMHKNAKKVRSWIDTVNELFTFSPMDYQERVPNQNRLTVCKKNNPVQIFIKNFAVQIKDICLTEDKDPLHTKQLEATLRKETEIQFKRHQMVVKRKEMRDIMTAFRQDALKPLSAYDNQTDSYKLKRNQLFYHIFLGALENTVKYYDMEKQKDSNFRFRNIAGFFRQKIRHYTSQALTFDLSNENMFINAFKAVDDLDSSDLKKLRDMLIQAERNRERMLKR